MQNKLYIASAGAGKTTKFVREALNCEGNVLITTFTEANRDEIKKKFYKLNSGIIPANITVRTWFSFLIEHGAKPYQGKMINERINGLLLVNSKSGLKFKGKKNPYYYKEEEVNKHFFSSDFRIYSDKLSKFVFRCNEKSEGKVIERISALYNYIFIDEVQDMAGYDLALIKLLLDSNITIKMAGDPRQVTYYTHFSEKYKKYNEGKIDEFILNECKKGKCEIDYTTLQGSWRNNEKICEFANKIFPEQPSAKSLTDKKTNHDGVFLVKNKYIRLYLEQYKPLQLRYSKSQKVIEDYRVKNFGDSKGITENRVLIYPTKNITEWLILNTTINSFETRSKLYVAVTRARHSVAFVCDDNIETTLITIYDPTKV